MKIVLHEKDGFVYAKVDAERSEFNEMRSLGLAWMKHDIAQLIKDANKALRLSIDENSDWSQLCECVDGNSAVSEYVINVWHDHTNAYISEAAIHVYLGNDWRLVFKYNELYSSSDGSLKDKTLYDVYTRSKNKHGLSKVPKEAIGIYVLTHYCGGLVFLVGYATLDELKRGTPEKYSRRSVPINKLHQVCFLKSDYRLGLESHVSEERLLNLEARFAKFES